MAQAIIKKLIHNPYHLILPAFLLYVYVSPVRAGSVHSFNSGMHCGVWHLPDTGQTICYDTSGAVITCSGAGVDGSVLGSSPSYTLNGTAPNQTTTDNITGLMWATDGAGAGCNSGGALSWGAALSFCDALSFAGYTDWRLPNVRELMSIVNYQNIGPAINTTYFPGTVSNEYWSSSTDAPGASSAWFVSFLNGYVSVPGKSSSYYVRCVRGGV